MEFNGAVQGASWRWPLLLSVVVLNIFLPSLVLSYGVLLVQLVENEVPIWLGLSTPAILILIYGLTQCWCREAADSWGGPVGYRAMAAAGLVAVVVSLFVCALIPYYWHPFVYGILGGFGSSLISAQVDAVVFETYDAKLGLVRGFCFAAQAVGQALFPHIFYALIDYYDYSYAYIVISAIMLQTLPMIMFLKIDESIKTKPVSYSRYSDLAKTYDVFNNENLDTNFYTTELQLHEMSKKCWKSPSDDNLHRETHNEDEFSAYPNEVNATVTPPPSPEEKRRNIFGVEILPEIPEESEESEDDEYSLTDKSKGNNRKRFSAAIQRLSTLGENLDECISNSLSRRDSQSDKTSENREYLEVEVTYDTVSPVTDIEREKIFNSFSFRCQSAYASMKRRMWMPSYKVYRIKRRTLYFIYSINDTLVKPLTRSLSCWRFYPSLFLAFTKLSLTAVFLPLMPLVAAGIHPKISALESNFLMSLYAFSWLCFLLCTPWLVQTRKRNFKYIALIGLVISTSACFVLAEANNHDMISIGLVIAGFGYGAITSSWETTIQDFLGARKWPKLHSSLETLSGCLLAVFVVGISFVVGAEGGLQYSLFILGVTLSVITVIWTVLVAVSIYVTKVRSMKLGGRWLR